MSPVWEGNKRRRWPEGSVLTATRPSRPTARPVQRYACSSIDSPLEVVRKQDNRETCRRTPPPLSGTVHSTGLRAEMVWTYSFQKSYKERFLDLRILKGLKV